MPCLYCISSPAKSAQARALDLLHVMPCIQLQCHTAVPDTCCTAHCLLLQCSSRHVYWRQRLLFPTHAVMWILQITCIASDAPSGNGDSKADEDAGQAGSSIPGQGEPLDNEGAFHPGSDSPYSTQEDGNSSQAVVSDGAGGPSGLTGGLPAEPAAPRSSKSDSSGSSSSSGSSDSSDTESVHDNGACGQAEAEALGHSAAAHPSAAQAEAEQSIADGRAPSTMSAQTQGMLCQQSAAQVTVTDNALFKNVVVKTGCKAYCNPTCNCILHQSFPC